MNARLMPYPDEARPRRSAPTKVLIADDHPVVRLGLRAVLEADPAITIVAEARDGQETLELARDTAWDVAVVDFSMPGTSGVELVRQIKRHRPERPVLVLSTHSESLYGVQAMTAGASGCLNKESAEAELTNAVRKVAGGGTYVSPALAEKLIQGITARGGHSGEPLSERENQVMRLLANGKPLVQISRELCLSASAVSTYRLRVLRKLKLSRNAELVRYALKEFEEPEA